jgi:hypothetical protein
MLHMLMSVLNRVINVFGHSSQSSNRFQENHSMSNLNDLATLICGGQAVDDALPTCEFSNILIHLRSVLETTLSELELLSNESPQKIALYGPYLARSLLEVAITAIVGRLDPTRLLVVKRMQEHSNYDTSKPWNSSIRWQGDVVADGKDTDLWNPNVKYKDMTKALLGDYYVEIYWSAAFKRLSESTANGGDWLAELKGKTSRQFSGERRTSLAKLYSSLSKGVHSEYVVPLSSACDRATVSNQIGTVVQILSELGLLLNFLPHVAYKLSETDALTMFNKISSIEVMA